MRSDFLIYSWTLIMQHPTSLYIFQKTVVCKIPLLRLCHYKLASSAKTLLLTVQPNLMTLLLRINLGHWNISLVEEILSQMKRYKEINVKYLNKLYCRPANQYESDSPNNLHSLWHKFDASLVSWFKEVRNLSLITISHIKQLNPISKSLYLNALNSFKMDKFSMCYLQMNTL